MREMTNKATNIEKPSISIIVPIYKAENYLHRCINSILSQTFSNFELLLVDDGSPDKSGAICDDFAQKDNRIRVFHKNNGGVSSARQCGTDNAIGEYSIHIDPDDWVDPTMLEELYNKATNENADIVICDLILETSKNRSIYNKQEPGILEQNSILKELLSQKLHGSLCNKLIKHSLYKDNNIFFPKEIIRWEDLYIVCSILAKAPVKISYLNKAFYHYDQYTNNNSIVRKVSMKGLMSQIYFVDSFSKIIDIEQYKECFYKLKASTKELAFVSGLYSNTEVFELYSEINDEYISKKAVYNLQKYLQLLLKKRYTLSSILLWCYSIKEQLKSIIKK